MHSKVHSHCGLSLELINVTVCWLLPIHHLPKLRVYHKSINYLLEITNACYKAPIIYK